jgi:hypothetical protein
MIINAVYYIGYCSLVPLLRISFLSKIKCMIIVGLMQIIIVLKKNKHSLLTRTKLDLSLFWIWRHLKFALYLLLHNLRVQGRKVR